MDMKKILLPIAIMLCTLVCNAQHDFESLIDVQQYTINIDITDFSNKAITANTIVNLKVNNENTNSICLYLQSLTVDSIKCADYAISNYTHNDTIITINFETAPTTDQAFDIDIYYHGNPQKDPSGWGGFYFSGDFAFNMGCGFNDVPHNYGRVWFPCNDNFYDKAKYTTIVTVPETYTAVCGGELTRTTQNENGTQTFTWVIDKNISTYLESVAVGKYYHHHHTYHGINRDIPVDIFGYTGDSARIAASFVNIDTIMSVYEHLYGEYPWNRVGYVLVPFNSGAMEHVSNISVGKVFLSGTDYETLFYHELSHQWFGDLITCATAEEMWINEGWATYNETIFKEFIYGINSAKSYRRSAHKNVITKTHRDDGEYLPLSPNPVYNTYSSNVYNRGASTVHTLRHYLGDEVFFDAVKHYLTEFSYRTVTSTQMRDFLTQYTGKDMTPFFDAWVFTPGFLQYAIDSTSITPNGSNYDITVYVSQKLNHRDSYADANRVEITFMKNDFSYESQWMEFDGENGYHTFSVPFEPALIMCDYNEKISDATIDQPVFIGKTGNTTWTDLKLQVKAISDTALVRVTCNFAAPDDFTEPTDSLSIVKSRYWLVESILPETFDATIQITFNNAASGYEYGHITNEQLDSLVLLYRPDKHQNWQVIPATYSIIKRFTVDHFMPGEYAIAIRHDNMKVASKNRNSFSVFPNPTKDSARIVFDDNFNGEIFICDETGKILMTKKVKTEAIDVNLQDFSNGTYIITAKNKKETISKKIIKN